MKASTIAGNKPSAYIAVNKNRMKVYEDSSSVPTYYLQDGTEFQIELFNPTEKTILAKIKLNDAYITQGGLVLKPGQRVFLERYLDVAKKFKFETYSVESNNEDVANAIKSNGGLEVEFFNEFTPYRFMHEPFWHYNNEYYYGSPSLGTNFTGYNTTGIAGGSFTNSANLINTSNTSFFNPNAVKGVLRGGDSLKTRERRVSLNSLSSNEEKNLSIETGRVEKGSESSQQISTVDKEFEFLSFHKITAKLLPFSQQRISSEDIVVKAYCTNCGTKQKKGFKFCPSCGTKN